MSETPGKTPGTERSAKGSSWPFLWLGLAVLVNAGEAACLLLTGQADRAQMLIFFGAVLGLCLLRILFAWIVHERSWSWVMYVIFLVAAPWLWVLLHRYMQILRETQQ